MESGRCRRGDGIASQRVLAYERRHRACDGTLEVSATIRAEGNLYRLVATVEEGQTLYFAGGRAIAVEKFDMRIGSSEFDRQVTSRQVRGGRPDQIMAQQESLNREFMESRVKSNLSPSDATEPVDAGFGTAARLAILQTARRNTDVQVGPGEPLTSDWIGKPAICRGVDYAHPDFRRTSVVTQLCPACPPLKTGAGRPSG